MWMGVIAVVLFMGVSVLAYKVDAQPSNSVSVLSEIARARCSPPGRIVLRLLTAVQATTAAVLSCWRRTPPSRASRAWPRCSPPTASWPRQFSNLGDRLVYSNGILVLALAAGALIVGFHADVLSLIHLYLLGVFTPPSRSPQLGMVRPQLGAAGGAGGSKGSLIYKIGPQRHRPALLTGLVGVNRDRHEVRRGRPGWS